MDQAPFHDAMTQITGALDTDQNTVPRPLGRLHRWILNEFDRTGAPPSPELVVEWAAELGIDARDALAQLAARFQSGRSVRSHSSRVRCGPKA